MTHVYIASNIFLPLQDTSSIGPFKFNNCSIGQITRVGDNNVFKKEGKTQQADDTVVHNITVSNQGIAINFGQTLKEVETGNHRYQFNNCDIREFIHNPPRHSVNACTKDTFSYTYFNKCFTMTSLCFSKDEGDKGFSIS